MLVENVKQGQSAVVKEPGEALGLKAERVQEELALGVREVLGLKAERVQVLLQAGWRLIEGATALQRVRVFPHARVAQEYSNYVSALANALRLSIQTRLAGRRCDVILRLVPGPAGGVEEALIELGAELG